MKNRWNPILLLGIVCLCTLPPLAAQQKDKKPLLPDEAIDVSGFWEVRLGYRTRPDPYERDLTLGHTLFHIELQKQWEKAEVRAAGDLVDDYLNHKDRRQSLRLEKGEGFFDARELNVAVSVTDFLQLRAGRQMLKWGSGDLVFINDLFPKDWNAFYSGRDEAYLRAPSDAVICTVAADDAFRLEVVYTPRFDADRYVDGRRLSYYNRSIGRVAGRDAIVRAHAPDDWFDDDEIALRILREQDGLALALYGYDGFWKSPSDPMPITSYSGFPKLTVLGASAEGDLAGGRANVEAGFYLSREDRSGRDPWVPNDEFRVLAGYRFDVTESLELGAQYYLERMMDYSAYCSAYPTAGGRLDRDRHLTTLRVTQYVAERALALSLFSAWSFSAGDAYLRPCAHYTIDDHFSIELGANLFFGSHEETRFGQYVRNSNVYSGFRLRF
ncbi:MAG: hypothetical protein ABIK28_14815 [Planctomycetota bacterium]